MASGGIEFITSLWSSYSHAAITQLTHLKKRTKGSRSGDVCATGHTSHYLLAVIFQKTFSALQNKS